MNFQTTIVHVSAKTDGIVGIHQMIGFALTANGGVKMARLPDGWVLIPNVSGPKVKDGKCYADVHMESRELVMCKNCKWWDKNQTTDGVKGFCPNTGCCEQPDFYCADGERRDEDGSAD